MGSLFNPPARVPPPRGHRIGERSVERIRLLSFSRFAEDAHLPPPPLVPRPDMPPRTHCLLPPTEFKYQPTPNLLPCKSLSSPAGWTGPLRAASWQATAPPRLPTWPKSSKSTCPPAARRAGCATLRCARQSLLIAPLDEYCATVNYDKTEFLFSSLLGRDVGQVRGQAQAGDERVRRGLGALPWRLCSLSGSQRAYPPEAPAVTHPLAVPSCSRPQCMPIKDSACGELGGPCCPGGNYTAGSVGNHTARYSASINPFCWEDDVYCHSTQVRMLELRPVALMPCCRCMDVSRAAVGAMVRCGLAQRRGTPVRRSSTSFMLCS